MIYAEELVTNSIGRRFWIYKDDTFYQQRIANAGPYQKQNLLRLRSLVPNPRTMLDIGMNIGMNSIEYATYAENVHGFEPTPQTYAMAVKNIDLAKQQKHSDMIKGWWQDNTVEGGWADTEIKAKITTHNIGIGNKPGKFEIIIKKNNAGSNHIENIDIPRANGKIRTRRFEPEKATIQVKTVDSFQFDDVDVIKVDTEGYEFFVVQGAENTIMKTTPVVQLEMVEAHEKKFGHSCQDIYDWFLKRDYVITLSDGTNVGTEWKYVFKKSERFFIHKSKI